MALYALTVRPLDNITCVASVVIAAQVILTQNIEFGF